MNGCPWYDEYSQCCMWERMERIYRFPWEKKEVDLVIKECLEEMP